jgi:hypothetical protein
VTGLVGLARRDDVRAGLALAASGAAWGLLLARRGPSTTWEAIAVASVAAAVGTAAIGLLAWSFFSRTGASKLPWLVTHGAAFAVLALGTNLLPRAHGPKGLVIGFGPVLAVAVAVALARPDRGKVLRFGWSALVWAGAVTLYWALTDSPSIDRLVWDASDQVHYHRIGINLLQGQVIEFRYMIGLPLLLGAFDVLGGVRDGSIPATQDVNVVALPTFLLLVGPVVVHCAASAIGRATRRVGATAYGAFSVAVTGGLIAYAAISPGWVPARNADLVPRRLLGLVFAPEPLTAAFYAGALWIVATAGDRRPGRWDATAVGLASGIVILLREPNVALVALTAVLAVRSREVLVRVGVAAVAAAVVVAGQLLVWQSTFGKLLAPNREAQWDEPIRRLKWSRIAAERYGYEGSAPPRVSWDWAATNLRIVIGPYAVVLVVVGLLALVALLRHREQWRLWFLVVAFTAGTVLFNASYINIEVLFRYNSIVVPGLLVVAIAGAVSLPSLLRDRRR